MLSFRESLGVTRFGFDILLYPVEYVKEIPMNIFYWIILRKKSIVVKVYQVC